MRPGFQEMPDIAPAAFAARADERGRHLHLVEGLIPDVVEPIRLRHPRPDAGIDEVEEEQSGDALRRLPRQRLHQRAADVVADDAGLLRARAHPSAPACRRPAGRGRTAPRACRCRRSRAGRARYSVKRSASRVMTGSQVSQNSGQPCSNSSGCPAPDAGHMERRAIGLNRQMLHFWLLFASRRRRGFLGPAPCLARHPRLELAPTAGRGIARHGAWRGGRVVECTALEMRHRCKPIGGSNPSLSASSRNLLRHLLLARSL